MRVLYGLGHAGAAMVALLSMESCARWGRELTVWPMNLAMRFCRATLHSASEALATSSDCASGAAPVHASAWLPALKRTTCEPQCLPAYISPSSLCLQGSRL